MTELNESLVKIAKGSGIAFVVSAVSMGLALFGRLLVARIGTEAEYGIFSIALVILNIFVAIGGLGLEQGVTRTIAFARGRNDSDKVQDLIPIAIRFGFVGGVGSAVILFFVSDVIAARIFQDSALSLPLKLIAMGIPFFIMMDVLGALFRGFDDVKPRVFFREFLRTASFLLLLLPTIVFSLTFNSVFYAFLASLAIPCIAFLVYTAKRFPYSIKSIAISSIAISRKNSMAMELLFFSLPLLGLAIIQMLVAWIDTLMLGGMKSSTEVGLYNTAYPLAVLIVFPLTAVLMIYMPIATTLYSQGLVSEARRNFAVLTKWICSATLPLFLILFLFPETIISFLFGENYSSAANALRILSLGFFIGNFLGPIGGALIAIGRTQFVMWVTFAAVILNIGLNVALIPHWGIEGAAIASAVSTTSARFAKCWRLYSLDRTHPLSKNLIKPALASSAIIFLLHWILGNFITIVWWMIPLFFIVFYAIYGLVILVTRSFDQEDIAMIVAIEDRVGVNATVVKRYLQRFL